MEKTVLKEIDQKVIGDLEKILILKTGSEDNKQNLSNEIKEVLSIVSIEILKRSGDTNLFSASPTSILCNIAENFKNDDIKFEKYIRIEKSPNFENYLPKNSERIYKTFKLFIYQQLMTNNETFGFDMLLFPGLRLENKEIFKLPFFDVISSYSFDSEPNLDFVKSSKMDLSYRGVIFEENLIALNEARNQYQKIDTGSVLFKDFREKFVKFNMSVNKNTTAESSTEVSDFFEWILGTKVLHFFEIHYGERVSIVHQADPGDLDISELLNKVGKQTNGYNKIVLLEKERADVPELYGTKIVDYLKNELTIESVDLKNSEDNSEIESLLKIDLLQDIVFSIIFDRMNFVYGNEISKIFQNAKDLAVKIIYSTSGKNWEQDYRQNEKTFSGGLPEFSVFRVVLSSFLKSAANMTDPTWKVFPLTPIGWAARCVDSEENGTESGRPAKKDVCKD